MKNLTNKVAVVTGAGSGIGRAIAIDLAAAGCLLVLVDINAEGMADVVDEIAQAGGSATAHVADVSDESSITALVDTVMSQHREVNVLVNNAGVVALGRFKDVELSDFAWVNGINAWGSSTEQNCALVEPSPNVSRAAPSASSLRGPDSDFGVVGG